MTKSHEIVVSYFWIWEKSDSFTECWLWAVCILLWSPADISRTLSLLSCCLHCNFPLLLIPPLSASHHQQFLFISPLNTFLSLSAPRSPCLTASTRHHQLSLSSKSSCFHHRSPALPRQSSFSINLPRLSPDFSPFSNSLYSFPPTYHLSALLCFLNIAIILRSVHFNALICSVIQNFSCFSSSAVSFSFRLCLPPLPPPTPFSLFGSFFLLTVSRTLVLNSLSNPLTSGSIVCPLIITYHLPSAHCCTDTIGHWAPLFPEFPCGRCSSEMQHLPVLARWSVYGDTAEWQLSAATGTLRSVQQPWKLLCLIVSQNGIKVELKWLFFFTLKL